MGVTTRPRASLGTSACALLVITLVVSACGEEANNGPDDNSLDEGEYSLVFSEESAAELSAGDDVRVGGVSVGMVTEVAPGSDQGQVIISIEPDYRPLCSDVKVSIRVREFFGEQIDEPYVDIASSTQGDGPILGPEANCADET